MCRPLTSSNVDDSDPLRLERLDISGVSVSPTPGFFVLVEASRGTIPLRVTSDPQDAFATTSPEALTLVQLLSGVDMAGAILPPETLARMMLLSIESVPEVFLENEAERDVLEAIRDKLPEGVSSYSDAHPWVQSRITLPQVTLDQLNLSLESQTSEDSSAKSDSVWRCELQCNVKSIGTVTVLATPDIVQATSYNYDPKTSALFTCIALALRYKAPIVLKHSDDMQYYSSQALGNETNLSLDDMFPQRTTVAKLKQQSTRVAENIERGFEVHKLTKALEMARKFGDIKAEEKIQAELSKFESFDDLPTTGSDLDKTSNENTTLQRDDPTSGEEDDAAFQ